MRQYFYYDKGIGFVRIYSKSLPHGKRANGPFSLREWCNVKLDFIMPCFPQVTKGRLLKMTYIGSIKEPKP